MLQIVAAGEVLGVIAVAEQHDVDAAVASLGGFLQGYPFVLAVFVAVLRDGARMGIVFVLQSEHYLALAVARVLRHALDGERHFGFLVAAGWRHLTPVGLALHFPFALGVDDQGLLVLCAQRACHRRAAHQLVMGCDALELAPAAGCLILLNGRLGHFEREVVFCHAVEGAALHIGRHGALAYYRSDAVAVLECSAIALVGAYGLKSARQDDALQTATLGEGGGRYAHHVFGYLQHAHQSPVVSESS